MFDSENLICACKGVRKCVRCAPDLITQEISNEKNSLTNSNELLVYCINCNKSVKADISIRKILIDYLDQKVSNIPCMCQDKIEYFEISGIYIHENFITFAEEHFLLSEIEKSKWIESQSGRFKQDYGPKANFKHKKLKHSTFTGLPVYSKFLINKLQNCSNKNIRNFIPVELCNLKYESSRGACIEPHFDDFWLWGERLITFNLLENTFLTLTPGRLVDESYNRYEVLLPMSRFSMIALTKDARFKWMHGIKKSHIKNCRQAITIRELTDEFKNMVNVGEYLENLALTFKGIDVGTTESFLNDKNKTENSLLSFCLSPESLEKVDIYLEKMDNYLINEIESEEFYFNIGKYIAKWTAQHQQILPEIINDEKQKSLTIRSVQNLYLILTDFDEYRYLLRDYLSKKCLEPSLKSKIISSVYQVYQFMKKICFSESFELAYHWFDSLKETNESKRKKTFISLKFDNLALFFSSLVVKESFEIVKIKAIFKKLVSGYSSEILLEPEHLNFINSLTFLNLVFNLPNENVLFKIENFYLITF